MADSFFGFDTSLSNLNDDEGGGGPSEDEYDALNDETFGQAEDIDWEHDHEHMAGQLESSRRHNASMDDADSKLEASLSKLVLDETDSLHRSSSSFNSVWRNDGFFTSPSQQPAPLLKNVVSVEELERQLRQKQQPSQQGFNQHGFMQPRFQQQPVILQRPPGLQAPAPLPFSQQPMGTNMNQHNQQLNKLLGQNNLMNQMGQSNQLMNHLGQNMNQMGQNMNQMGQNVNQIGQNMNQMGQNVNQMGQNVNQYMQNSNQLSNQQLGFHNSIGPSNMLNQFTQNNPSSHQMQKQVGQNVSLNQLGQKNQMSQNMNQVGQNMNQMGQNMNQMNQNVNQMGQNMNPIGQNMNPIGQNMNQIGQNMNQMGQNMNQMNQNMNQMLPNGNKFGSNMNQFQHMMGQQPRMMGPPPGLMQRQNYSPNVSNVGQYNHNFRGPSEQMQQQITPQQQQNLMLNQQMLQQTQMKNQSQQNNQPNMTHSTPNKQLQQKNQRSEPKQQQSQQKSRMPDYKVTQNLVQLIKNTHPMLQFNNSFHNANHHPMLNQRNNVFNSNQYNHPMFNNQRNNGTFSNNRSSINGDDNSVSSETDDYAGLMTQREKQWLINIQMLQLNTGTPYIHDFYYTVFLERQANKEKEGIKEAHKANQQNHPFYSGGVTKQDNHNHVHSRERHNSVRHNSTSEDGQTPRTYVPAQFENSLGKLQCGSVTAPRKIIDAEVVSGEPATPRVSRCGSVASLTPTEVPRETKRTKQLLLDIEALYLILLRLEELNDPLAIANALILKEREEKQKILEASQKEALYDEEDSNVFLRNIESVQKRKQDSPKSETIDKRQVVNLAVSAKPPVKNLLDEDKEELLNKVLSGLLHADRLPMILTVRKGRTLVCRVISRVPLTHPRLRFVWARLLRSLSSVARRDDNQLPVIAPHFKRYIQSTSGWSAVLESCSMLAEAFDPARTPYALMSPLTLSCICVLIDKASTLVITPEANSNERQWYKFLKTVARSLKNTTLSVAKPVQPLSEAKLHAHLKQLESRTTIEILQRGRTTVEFADLSKQDVLEYLTKYLC